MILLLGAEFTFALQNADTYQLESAADSASTRTRLLVALMVLRRAGRAMGGGQGPFDVSEFAHAHKAPIRLVNAVVAALARRGYLGQAAGRDAGYVLMRAAEANRNRDLVAELRREGGGHAELDGLLNLDAPLRETLAKIETGLAQGFGDLTLADMVAAAPAAPAP